MRTRRVKFLIWFTFNVVHDLGLGLIGRWVDIPLFWLLGLVLLISFGAFKLSERLEHREECQCHSRGVKDD